MKPELREALRQRIEEAKRKQLGLGSSCSYQSEWGYNRGCRCAECTRASTTARYLRRKKIAEKPFETHGRASYNNGCRCDICKKSQRDYRRMWSKRKRMAACS